MSDVSRLRRRGWRLNKPDVLTSGMRPSVYEACYFLGLSPKKFMAQVRGLRDQGAEIKWFWLAGKNHENEIPVSKTELEQRAIAGGVARSFYQLQGSTRGKDGE